jgi:hypothetical protein
MSIMFKQNIFGVNGCIYIQKVLLLIDRSRREPVVKLTARIDSDTALGCSARVIHVLAGLYMWPAPVAKAICC